MRKLTLVSSFRDSEKYLDRYFEQVYALRAELAKHDIDLHLVLGYGDCQDDTKALLHEHAMSQLFSVRLVDVSHGGPKYHSVVDKQRFKQLAFIGNSLWKNIPFDTDYVVLAESDLIWKAKDIWSLLETLETEGLDLIAPMVLHENRYFYDTWAFRVCGTRFQAKPPYHHFLEPEVSLYSMDSVGSLFVATYESVRNATWPEKDVVVGFCKQLRDNDYGITLDTSVRVYHP